MRVFKLPMVVTDEVLDKFQDIEDRLCLARKESNAQAVVDVSYEKEEFIRKFQSGCFIS